MTKKILFILPVATQPRFAKRIQAYLDDGWDVNVAAFQRTYFEKNQLPAGVNCVMLGSVQSGRYWKRGPVLFRGFLKNREIFQDKRDIYVFSPDVLLLLTFVFPNHRFIYELGDIRSLKVGLRASLYAKLYSRALHRCAEVVVTSEKFKDYLSETYRVSQGRVKLIENRLLETAFPLGKIKKFKRLGKEELTVGIIGLLRYRNVINFLEARASQKARFNIHIYGDGPLMDEVMPYLEKGRVEWYGQFKYPDDLEPIYEKVDLSFVMYDSTDLNVKLALPNKLYESMYFRKPLVCSSGTFLEKKVTEFNVGFSWDQGDMRGLVRFIDSPEMRERYNRLESSFEAVDREVFLYR